MNTYQVNLVVNQGADYSFDLPKITDSSNNPFDLTDYTVTAQLRKHYGANKYTSFTATKKAPASSGIIILSLTDSQTKNLDFGRYVYDVIITSNTGVKTRVFEGLVTVNGGVTF